MLFALFGEGAFEGGDPGCAVTEVEIPLGAEGVEFRAKPGCVL